MEPTMVTTMSANVDLVANAAGIGVDFLQQVGAIAAGILLTILGVLSKATLSIINTKVENHYLNQFSQFVHAAVFNKAETIIKENKKLLEKGEMTKETFQQTLKDAYNSTEKEAKDFLKTVPKKVAEKLLPQVQNKIEEEVLNHKLVAKHLNP
jgi:hypothetical protein